MTSIRTTDGGFVFEGNMSGSEKIIALAERLSITRIAFQLCRDVSDEYWVNCIGEGGETIQFLIVDFFEKSKYRNDVARKLSRIGFFNKEHMEILMDYLELLVRKKQYKGENRHNVKYNQLFLFFKQCYRNKDSLPEGTIRYMPSYICLKKDYVTSNMGYSSKAIKEYAEKLREKGIIVGQKGNPVRQLLVGNKRSRYYCFKESVVIYE